jgi:inner membrane protease ATP23
MSENTGTAIAETDEQKKCLKRLGGTVEHNMVVHKLMDSIVNLGCKLPEEFLSCRKCGPHMSGGFLLPQQGKEDSYVPKVVLCNNDNIDFISFNNTIIHELIHAYDACRAKVDWKNCSHIACTEIRAAALRYVRVMVKA